MPKINVISLSAYVFDCAICDTHQEVSYGGEVHGIARYEDEVVPDGYTGDWAGATVCERCYWIERGLHAKAPEAFIPFSVIRKVSVE